MPKFPFFHQKPATKLVRLAYFPIRWIYVRRTLSGHSHNITACLSTYSSTRASNPIPPAFTGRPLQEKSRQPPSRRISSDRTNQPTYSLVCVAELKYSLYSTRNFQHAMWLWAKRKDTNKYKSVCLEERSCVARRKIYDQIKFLTGDIALSQRARLLAGVCI